MLRLLKRLGCALGFGLLAIVAAVLLTARPGDPDLWPPAPDMASVTVHLVSNGFHVGLAVPRSALREAAQAEGQGGLLVIADRFGAYPTLEIGWGEEVFYRDPAIPGSFDPWLALRALLRPGNGSVLHVVGVSEDPLILFSGADVIAIPMSEKGFRRLVRRMGESVALRSGLPEEMGQGLYGPSLFYRAVGTFNLFSVCNHWVARLLAAAGLPHAPILATHPAGLLLDLRFRAGLIPTPNPAGQFRPGA